MQFRPSDIRDFFGTKVEPFHLYDHLDGHYKRVDN